MMWFRFTLLYDEHARSAKPCPPQLRNPIIPLEQCMPKLFNSFILSNRIKRAIERATSLTLLGTSVRIH